MYSRVQTMLRALDRRIAKSSLAAGNEEGVLLTFLFHGLFEESIGGGASSDVLNSHQITVEMFQRFLDYFHRHSYQFVSPADISRGLDRSGKHVLVTFDDGYYSCTRALPLLEAFHAPAVVFVSTNHIFENKAFWWGVIERKARARAVPEKEVRRMVEQLKRLKTEEAECEVRAQFGSDALRPVNDLHRPLTPSELRDLANHPLITVGNHTQDHAILTNYSASEAFAQIQGAQEDIHTLTGKVPDIIAYPNGNETPGIADAARKAGIHFGLGVAPGRNRLPLEPGSKEAMTMKRFMLTGDCSIEAQCRVSRSLFSLYRMGRKVKRKISGGYSAPQLA